MRAIDPPGIIPLRKTESAGGIMSLLRACLSRDDHLTTFIGAKVSSLAMDPTARNCVTLIHLTTSDVIRPTRLISGHKI